MEYSRNPLVRAALVLLLGLLALIGVRHAARVSGLKTRHDDSSSAVAQPMAAPKRLLLIGNSLSAPIPDVLSAMAFAAGTRLEIHGVTPGGTTLAQHATSSATLTAIGSRRWDIVVLQEQGQEPSYAEAQREREMYPAGTRLVEAARSIGATPWLYGHYARKAGDPDNVPGDSFANMQARIDQGYANLAGRTGTHVVPVGRAWRQALEHGPALALWGPDGLHAAAAGNYLIAAVFLAALVGIDPSEVHYDGGLPAGDARALRIIAKDAVLLELPVPLHAPSNAR
jgi:hypothetical protein